MNLVVVLREQNFLGIILVLGSYSLCTGPPGNREHYVHFPSFPHGDIMSPNTRVKNDHKHPQYLSIDHIWTIFLDVRLFSNVLIRAYFFFALVGGNQFSREPSSTCPSVPAGSIDPSGLRICSGAGARTTSSRIAPPLGTVGFGWLSGGHSGALCERGIPYSLRTTVRQLAPAGCGRFHEASCCRPGSHTALHLHHSRH
jgi:hypothetical protein